LILREDGDRIGAERRASTKGDSRWAGELVRRDRAGGTAGDTGGLPHVWHDSVEGVAASGVGGPQDEEERHDDASKWLERFAHSLPLTAGGRNLRLAQGFAPDTLLKNLGGEIFHAGLGERLGGWIEDWGFRGVLRHAFAAGMWIAMDAESALRPPDDEKLTAGMPAEKEMDFLAGTKFRSAFHVRMQVLEFATGLPHHDFLGQIAFLLPQDPEAGVRPDLAVFHVRLRAHAAHTGYSIGVLDKILKVEARERGGPRNDGNQKQPNQKQDPEGAAAFDVAHR